MRTIAIIIALTAILAAAATADTVAPVGMRNLSIGGGDLNAYTQGVHGGVGLNNVGLLIRTWGLVTYVETANMFFYIDDGSGLNDLTTIGTGVRVAYDGVISTPAFVPPTVGQYVEVTGISSLYSNGAWLVPSVKVRKKDDLLLLQ